MPILVYDMTFLVTSTIIDSVRAFNCITVFFLTSAFCMLSSNTITVFILRVVKTTAIIIVMRPWIAWFENHVPTYFVFSEPVELPA